MVEGDSLQLRCYARRGFPPPAVVWHTGNLGDSDGGDTVLGDSDGGDIVVGASEEEGAGEHLVSVSRVLVYRASRRHHNSSLTCTVAQPHTLPGAVLYSRYLVTIQTLCQLHILLSNQFSANFLALNPQL